MPALQRAFAASAEAVQLTLTTYFIGFALGQAFYGPIADRHGRKLPLYIGMSLYVLASLGCSLAPSIAAVAALRFVQAVGACAGIVIARAVVSDLFEAREAARVFAMLTMVMGVAPVVAPSVGAYLLVWFGWDAIFWALAAFGFACLVAAGLRLPETKPRGSTSPIAFGEVLVRYRMIGRDRRFLAYVVPGAFGMGGMFAYIAGSSFVFIGHFGFTPGQYALLFGLNSFAIVSGAQVNRLLLRWRRPEQMFRTALLVQFAAAASLLAMALAGPAGAWEIALPLFCYLATIGFVYPNTTALAMSSFRHQAGSASALLGATQSSLAAFTAIVVGAIGGETALPMALVIALYSLLAVWASRRILPGAPA